MAGKPGRSGGRNRVPVEEHLLRGTFRPARHGARPVTDGNVVAMPPSEGSWTPEPDDLAALTESGRAFVSRMLARYDFTPIEGLLLIEAGHAVSSLEAVREMSRAGRTLREAAAVERLELAWQKQFAALLAQLQVERP